MSSIATVFGYSWGYLRRYWGRLVASIVFGLIFALTNSSFIWATKTLTGRFNPQKPAAVDAANAAAAASVSSPWRERVRAWGEKTQQTVDPWLPRFGQRLDWRQITGLLVFLPLLVAVRAGSDYLNSYCMGWVTERVIRDMRQDLMTQLHHLSLDFFTHFKTGDLITRINMDTQNLLRCLRVGGADLIKESITVVAVFIGLCLLDPALTLSVMVLVPVCVFPMIVLGKKARRATRATLRANVTQSSQLVELLASIRVVKAFGLEQEQLDRFRKSSSQIVHAGMKGIQAKELVNPIIEVITVLGLSGLLLYV
ncbi:MAG TPA: ABC transporter transmembrane domain-containing protein, partial [Candidatus Dormibacteraeota bacterium]|nr:ABC transporter transmembrane domain-containing protein [Candidatus Dormibacteraeota bacterium]